MEPLRSDAGRVAGGYRDVGRGPRGGRRPYRCRGALLLLLLAAHRHAPHARRRRSCRGTTHHCSATATAGSSGGVCRRNRRGRVSCCRDKVAWMLHRLLLLLLRLLLLILLRVLDWHRHGSMLCVLLRTADGSVTSLLAHRSMLHLITHRVLLLRIDGAGAGGLAVVATCPPHHRRPSRWEVGRASWPPFRYTLRRYNAYCVEWLPFCHAVDMHTD